MVADGGQCPLAEWLSWPMVHLGPARPDARGCWFERWLRADGKSRPRKLWERQAKEGTDQHTFLHNLLKKWDPNRDGLISKMEFRFNLRSLLGEHDPSSKIQLRFAGLLGPAASQDLETRGLGGVAGAPAPTGAGCDS